MMIELIEIVKLAERGGGADHLAASMTAETAIIINAEILARAAESAAQAKQEAARIQALKDAKANVDEEQFENAEEAEGWKGGNNEELDVECTYYVRTLPA